GGDRRVMLGCRVLFQRPAAERGAGGGCCPEHAARFAGDRLTGDLAHECERVGAGLRVVARDQRAERVAFAGAVLERDREGVERGAAQGIGGECGGCGGGHAVSSSVSAASTARDTFAVISDVIVASSVP